MEALNVAIIGATEVYQLEGTMKIVEDIRNEINCLR